MRSYIASLKFIRALAARTVSICNISFNDPYVTTTYHAAKLSYHNDMDHNQISTKTTFQTISNHDVYRQLFGDYTKKNFMVESPVTHAAYPFLPPHMFCDILLYCAHSNRTDKPLAAGYSKILSTERHALLYLSSLVMGCWNQPVIQVCNLILFFLSSKHPSLKIILHLYICTTFSSL